MPECVVKFPSPRAGLMALTSVFTLALAACGGGGNDSSAPPMPPPLPAGPTVPTLSTGTPVALDYGTTIGTIHNWPDSDTSTGGQGADVDGLPCTPTMLTDYHVHAHVSIFLNGDQLILPQEIGIPRTASGTDACYYTLHTHDESGEVHVEAGAQGTYTLGQLFDIWGQPLDTTNANIGGVTGLPIAIYLFDEGDTQVTQFTGDPKTIELKAHRQITIQIGTPINTVQVYDFVGA